LYTPAIRRPGVPQETAGVIVTEFGQNDNISAMCANCSMNALNPRAAAVADIPAHEPN